MLVAEAFLDALLARGIEIVFANAGTDFASIIESLAKARETGKRVPRFLTVPHENVAVAMAHGYHRATGRVVGVMVHVTVGTANALCGLMNASRDNVPLLLVAGRSPITEAGHVGSRTAPIHWGQESFDPAGVVREYVKWDYELRASQSVTAVVNRALDIAMSEPRGPVYLTLPREVLASEHREAADHTGTTSSHAPAPAAAAIDELVTLVRRAKRPVVVTSALGRSASAVEVLTELAERYAIPVVEEGQRAVSLSSRHPMHLGSSVTPYLEWADLLLVVDSEVPWVPARGTPSPECRVAHLGVDPLFARYPMRTHRANVAVPGRAVDALIMLHDALEAHASVEAIEFRRDEIAAMQEERRAQRAKRLDAVRDAKPIHPAFLAACVNEVKSDETVIVNELGVPPGSLDLTVPGTYLSVGMSGGLGFGLGAALGVKLARPDRDVIAITGDGSQIFGNPVASYFVANAQKLAPLIVVSNNAGWNAVRTSSLKVHPDGHMSRAEEVPLVALEPSPRFDVIMQACGGEGALVEEPGELVAALERGLARAREGVPYVVNVRTAMVEPPG